MKALLMLDHVMLWVARVFVIGCIGLAFYGIVLQDPAMIKYPLVGAAKLLYLLLTLIGLWNIRITFFRFFLGIIASLQLLLLPLYIYSQVRIFHDLSLPAWPLLVALSPWLSAGALGSISILWTAIRAGVQREAATSIPFSLQHS
jgi:hypothetical protein